MRLIVLLFILCLSLAKAQMNDINHYISMHSLDSTKSETGCIVNIFSASNALSNKFISSLLRNEYLSDDIKNTNNIESSNCFGSDEMVNMYFINKPDSFFGSNQFGYRIGIESNVHRNMKFSDDFYRFVFFGNKDFAGKTADMSNFSSSYLKLQKFQFGVYKNMLTEMGNLFTYYIGLSLVKGQSDQFIKFFNSSVFTEQTGAYIDFKSQMVISQSDTSKTGIFDFNGIGGAANLFFAFGNTKAGYTLSLSMNYMGFLRWSKSSVKIHLDTTYRYDGAEINDFFHFGQSGMTSEINKDSIVDEFYSHGEKGSFTRILPERMNLQFTKSLLNEKIAWSTGMIIMVNANSPFPLFYTEAEFNLHKYFGSYLQFAYGGYTTYQVGLGIMTNLNDKYFLKIGSSNLPAFFSQENTYSQNIYLSGCFRF